MKAHKFVVLEIHGKSRVSEHHFSTTTCFVSKCASCYSVTLIVYIQLRSGDEYVNIFMY